MSLRVYFARDGQVSVSERGQVIAMLRQAGHPDLLALCDRALRKARRKRADITGIAVDRGPDGFSAVRARIAVATGLAAALGAGIVGVEALVPEQVAELPKKTFRKTAVIEPLYNAEPNITVSKKTIYGRS